jgi:hypothetical protein
MKSNQKSRISLSKKLLQPTDATELLEQKSLTTKNSSILKSPNQEISSKKLKKVDFSERNSVLHDPQPANPSSQNVID